MANVVLEVSVNEMHDLARDIKTHENCSVPYLTGNHFQANAPAHYRCVVPDDFLEKFPRWKANVVTSA